MEIIDQKKSNHQNGQNKKASRMSISGKRYRRRGRRRPRCCRRRRRCHRRHRRQRRRHRQRRRYDYHGNDYFNSFNFFLISTLL